jgi:predicted nicotinamide N-methyase
LVKLINRKSFLANTLGLLLLPATRATATALPSTVLSESAEDICQNGRLVEERAVPGAYSSVCMSLRERAIPLLKLQKRLQNENMGSGTMIIQQEAGGSGATGMTVWNSGLVLARLLDGIVDRLWNHSGTRDFWSHQDVMELGCGTGVGSIAAHLLGARSVAATDGNEKVLELTQRNIDRNIVASGKGNPTIEAKTLQWGLLNAIDYSESASLVLGADLTYNAGSWRVLAETMATVLSLDGDARIVYLSLGHEGFNVNAEMDGFLSVAKEVGLISVPDFKGIDLSTLLQDSLSTSERKVLEQNGGARVVVLKRKTFSSKS